MKVKSISLALLGGLALGGVSLSSHTVQAQSQTPGLVKVQKYNGYGIPNTKFKKIKVDLTKKKKLTPAEKAQSNLVTEGEKLNEKSNDELLKDVKKSTQQVTTKVETKPADTSGITFSFSLSSSYNTQAEKQTDGSRSEYLFHEIAPGIKYGLYSATGFFYYNDNIKTPEKTEWQDSAIVLSRSAFAMGSYVNFTPSFTGGLPLSKTSRETVQQKYTLGAAAAVSLNSKNAGVDNLILSYSLGYTKMFNEFETKTNGEPTTSYRFRQRYNIGYKITDKFTFKTRFQFDSSYSTQNIVRNAFYHYQNFDYNINNNLNVYLGHANGNSAFVVRESETDYYLENKIKFYDPETSEFYIGLAVSI